MLRPGLAGRRATLFLPLLCCLLPLAAGADDGAVLDEPVARIALIIDDLGYDLAAGRRVVQLPGPVACAVLPATPRGPALSELAAANGKEVLLHLPLQAQINDTGSGPHALRLDMNRDQFADVFASNLASVPHVSGVNNHRGSLLTRHPGHMLWLMEELQARPGLFFVDSYTTHHSVALQLAREAGLRAAKRDVFLDSRPGPQAVADEFERLKRLARRHGSALGIGHPYADTLDYLEQALPRLRAEGIELVSLREYLALREAPAAGFRQAD